MARLAEETRASVAPVSPPWRFMTPITDLVVRIALNASSFLWEARLISFDLFRITLISKTTTKIIAAARTATRISFSCSVRATGASSWSSSYLDSYKPFVVSTML
jgi:hypothetical protein